MTNKVFVGNLPWSIRTEALSSFLTELGFTYRSVKVIEDKDTGRSRGFAFVEFDTPQAAAEAIAELTGVVCEGRALFANEAKDNKSTNKPTNNGSSGGGGRPREPSRAERPSYPSTEGRRREKSNKPKRGRDDEGVW
jgi:RNA recognition motif-containing protein